MKRIPVGVGALIAALLVGVVLVACSACGSSESGSVPESGLPQGGMYRNESITMAVEGYWVDNRTDDEIAIMGHFPYLRVTVSCVKDCSLYLFPVIYYPEETGLDRFAQPTKPPEQVNLIAGETKSMVWAFNIVGSDSVAERVEIAVDDLTSKKTIGTAIFRLGEPTPGDPRSTTTGATSGGSGSAVPATPAVPLTPFSPSGGE